MKAIARLAAIGAAAGSVMATACRERSLPVEPAAAPRVPTDVTVPATSVSASAGYAASVIADALHRVIPGLGDNAKAVALHDSFDRIADALEADDRHLGKLVVEASETITRVASTGPDHWAADLDALRLALGTVGAAGETAPKKR